jgi:hypothetical protein
MCQHYPSLRSLHEAYRALGSSNSDEAAGLLTEKFGTGRKEGALSRKIYRVFNSVDPDEVL